MRARGDLAGEPPRPRQRAARLRWWQWVIVAALAVLLAGEAWYLWPRLHESSRSLTEIRWVPVAGCVLMQMVSISGFGGIQKQLLHTGGVQVTHRQSVAVVYAATAMAVTLPAGQVFSTAFTYRATRRWGAGPVLASWQLLMSGVVAAAGMVLLGFGGTLLAGDRIGPAQLLISVGTIVALAWAGNWTARHPDGLEAPVRAVLRLVNRVRRLPPDHGLHRVKELVRQLDSVQLNRRDALLVTWWAVVHRVADVACLGAACYAVGADPTWAGLAVAFSAGKAVGTIPLAPGGIVYVDATLIYSLTAAAGLPATQAVAAAFIYRLVSFILVAIAGWIVFAFLGGGLVRTTGEPD
ncbi:lysylphosphatidylglycerol synthase transmembrane domain-containing protein [Nocardia stercoris]|uniref:UPF0104 family protein n=1 Tax=Nocardia stercoris TaxID=2483361 RepID=A0A3M2LB59_9NOCA|nr:YbhN family protein [Nocardia stercoris]RMI33970.1 UPF0104 family protein [Nocardia stercoris]